MARLTIRIATIDEQDGEPYAAVILRTAIHIYMIRQDSIEDARRYVRVLRKDVMQYLYVPYACMVPDGPEDVDWPSEGG